MHLTHLHDDFYLIKDAFEDTTFQSLVREFDNKHNWNKLPQDEHIRLEGNPIDTNLHLLHQEISSVVDNYFSAYSYPNTTQLWYDYEGYINDIHCDLSPNLSANVQIYLCEGDTSMGTHCFIDDKWYSVPYVSNHGYLMFNPTQNKHGMRSPVIDKRMSLYQSFRITETPSPIW